MDLSGDDLAGIVDLFGALTREQLRTALDELAYRRGVEPPGEDRVDAAVESYALFEYDPPDGDEPLVVAGPAAFPTVPEGGEDLPHIMDVADRSVDREALGRAAVERLAAAGDADPDPEERERLLDLTYDLEAWAPVDATAVRERLTGE